MREPEFPALRLRRLRRTPALRALVRETRLTPERLLCPLFVRPGHGVREPIPSMPGQSRLSVDELVAEGRALADLGIGGVMLFGLPESKDPLGTGAYASDGIVQRAAGALKEDGSPLVIVADVCLCEYTDHGHCGVLTADGDVDNDATLRLYERAAVAQADAGADITAPSGMMDGQVAAIRGALDAAGHQRTAILAYAAKYASALYGPFRDAVDVSIADGGDRKGYQQDPANAREALEEIRADVAEGADIVMVKPALAYLDVIAAARAIVDLPLAAYHVSGEYSMIKAAAERGWIDGDAVALEHVTAIKRAGADIILTYLAKELAHVIGR